MSCGIAHRHGLDPTLLWLWCRSAATALIQPLAWGSPYAAGVALEKTHTHTHTHTHTPKPKINRFPDISPIMGLMGHIVVLYLFFGLTLILWSIVVVPIYTHTNSVGGHPFFHTLSRICYLYTY